MTSNCSLISFAHNGIWDSGFGIRDSGLGRRVSAVAESPIPTPQSRDAARGHIPSSIRRAVSSWLLLATRSSPPSFPLTLPYDRKGVVWGMRGSVGVEPGGLRHHK